MRTNLLGRGNDKMIDTRQFEEQKKAVLAGLSKLAEISPGGGLYIKDKDCSGGIYSLDDITIDDDGHVRIVASMWSPSELAEKTGYFRD